MLDTTPDDDDEPIPDDEALSVLVFAIENYINVVQRKLADKGLEASRDRIRERLFSPELRHLLFPKQRDA